jgi:uncharacterized membrane protein YcgQ (UPF0703/DUF1980 family)
LNLAGCGNEDLNTNINSNIVVEQKGNAADKIDTVIDNNKASAESEIALADNTSDLADGENALTDSETASIDRETTATDGNTASNDSEFSTTDSDTTTSDHEDVSSGVDVDLTQLSSTMVYSEVYNMLVSPDDYIGKTIKMQGAFSIYQDEATDKVYYTCIIADATACCSQGLEFVWKGEHKYPEDYPKLDSEITVTGEFQTYEEDGSLYCTLIDSEIESIQH